jgi:hypothetical protein
MQSEKNTVRQTLDVLANLFVPRDRARPLLRRK